MKVVVTGATGFTGTFVVPALLRRRVSVRCFVRPSSRTEVLPVHELEVVRGDLDDPRTLAPAFSGTDALVNLASLGFGHASGIVRAALEAGIRRAVFISTTAIFTRLPSAAKNVRLEAERVIRASGLDGTILRPTMIYGGPRDRNMCRLIRYLRRWPVVPVPGRRSAKQQPVYAGDIAEAVCAALEQPRTAGRSYDLAGGTALTLDEIIDTIATLTNRRIWKVHLPCAPVAAVLAAAERCRMRLSIRSEQILRLDEDKTFDFGDAARDFGYRPRTFREGISLELQAMGL